MKTVWIVNPFDNLPIEGCRPQRYWLMAEAFARSGCRVVLWTSDFNHVTKRSRLRLKVEVREEVEVVMIPTRAYRSNVGIERVLSHRKLARDFERIANERLAHITRGEAELPKAERSARRADPTIVQPPDLIIASMPPIGLCAAAMRVARKCGARFVCDIQDAWPETFERLFPTGFKWLGRMLFAPLRAKARRVYREADMVTGVSARYATLSGRKDFRLAYLGISGGDAAKVETRTSERNRLVYVGNLGEGYDLETVIEAVSRRSNLSLDIAGTGPKESALRRMAEKLRLRDRVRFHGFLCETELQSLLSQSEVGVIPMRDDSGVGLPNKLYDYLDAGLPIVSSLGGECGELLRRAGFGAVYRFGDVASLLSALDRLTEVCVSLPPELKAENIYSKYITDVACY